MSHSLDVANFLLALEKENDWRTLGIFLDVEDCKLDEIELLYESRGIRRCKEELFKVLKRREEYPTWEEITEALDNVGNRALAKEIREKYTATNGSQTHEVNLSPISIDMEVNTPSPKSVQDVPIKLKQYFVKDDVAIELDRILSKFAALVNAVRRKLVRKVSVNDLRCYIFNSLKLRISRDITTVDEVFTILNPQFCFIRYHHLENLVEAFLKKCKPLKQTFIKYKNELDIF